MKNDRDLDVVLFGATGFAGRLVATYLAEHASREVRIGLAGRSANRLHAERARLGPQASSWPLLVADSADPASMAALAAAGRVVASTVGPYRRHGLTLVEACARAGTDYVDLAGELLFIRDSIDGFHNVAASTGTRVVHSCGFDSIPSDLGVMLLHEAALAEDAGEFEDTTLVVTAFKGGFSGGTLATMKVQQTEVGVNPSLKRLIEDPYALSPERGAEPDLGDERDLQWVEHYPELDIWIGPFVMAGVNTRVVRRSNALQNWAYGRRFRYREVTSFGTGRTGPLMAAAFSGALQALMAGMQFGPSRVLLERFLPAPGEGPSDEVRRTGFFRIEVHARTATGRRYVARLGAQGDPGYTATAVMLGESALCLALDHDRLPDRAGVLTPATGLGIALVDRLRAAGQTLTAGPFPATVGSY